MITSSDSLRWNSRLRKSVPMTGIRAMPGNPEMPLTHNRPVPDLRSPLIRRRAAQLWYWHGGYEPPMWLPWFDWVEEPTGVGS